MRQSFSSPQESQTLGRFKWCLRHTPEDGSQVPSEFIGVTEELWPVDGEEMTDCPSWVGDEELVDVLCVQLL